MATGYLLILIGTIIAATFAFPIPFIQGILDIFSTFSLWGYVMIGIGMRYLPISKKEMITAFKFNSGVIFTMMAISWLPRILPSFIPMDGSFIVVLMLLYQIFSIGLYFWLFKAEYMWSPHASKRLHLLMYSGVGIIYFLLFFIPSLFVIFRIQNIAMMLSWFQMTVVLFSRYPLSPVGMIGNLFTFFNILYYAFLFYIIIKLYSDARGTQPGFKRWG